MGTLCDSGLTAIYTSGKVHCIDQYGTIVLMGTCSLTTKLWTVDIAPHSSSSIMVSSGYPSLDKMSQCGAPSKLYSSAVITEATGTTQHIDDYYFAVMGSCTSSSLIATLNDGYIKLPDLSATIIRRYLPQAITIAQVTTRVPFNEMSRFDKPAYGKIKYSNAKVMFKAIVSKR